MSHHIDFFALAPPLSRLVSSAVAWSFSNAGSLPSKLLQSAVSIAVITVLLVFSSEYLRRYRGLKITNRIRPVIEWSIVNAAILRGIDEYTIQACGGSVAWWKETYVSNVIGLNYMLLGFALCESGGSGGPEKEKPCLSWTQVFVQLICKVFLAVYCFAWILLIMFLQIFVVLYPRPVAERDHFNLTAFLAQFVMVMYLHVRILRGPILRSNFYWKYFGGEGLVPSQEPKDSLEKV